MGGAGPVFICAALLVGKVLKPTLNRLVLLVVDIIHLACPQMNISGAQQRLTNISTALRNVRAVFAVIPALDFISQILV